MLPTVVLIIKVRSALRAHLTEKAAFPAYYTSKTHILKSFFKPKSAFVKTAGYRCIDAIYQKPEKCSEKFHAA